MKTIDPKHTKLVLCGLLLSTLSACGTSSEPAGSCTATENADGTVTLQCGEDAPVTLAGPQGEQGPAGADGEPGEQGTAGMDGADGQTAAIRTEAATQEQCAYGGEVVYTGYDADNSGALEPGEETQNFIICQGAPGDGKVALVVSSPADASDCPTGGQHVKVGLDQDQSGALEEQEILDTFDVCNGEAGTPGDSALIEVTIDGARSCISSGDAVNVGLDRDGDGTLSRSEISGTFEVCDGEAGAAGQDGSNSLINIIDEAPSATCPFGGKRIEVGIDLDDNGTLDPTEVDATQTTHVCEARESERFVQVANSRFHACAVTTSGGVKCWGRNDDGELGNGANVDSSTPVAVSGLGSGVAKVSVGINHSCALTTAGGVKCWGDNNFGQLGDGTNTASNTPVDVNGLTSGVAELSAGTQQVCVVTSSGGVKCWGLNQSGQLGDGTTTNRNAPVDVTGLTSGGTIVSAGGGHACAVTDTATLRCWGAGGGGQLGNGTMDRTTPITAGGLSMGVSSVTAGVDHTCAITTPGGVKCWGQNGSGQLGNGTTTDTSFPSDVNGMASGVESVSAGFYYTCAVMTSGRLRCWGSNQYGQLGDGTMTSSTTAIDVSGLTSGVLGVSARGFYTCATIDTLGGAKCWGRNQYGQIGDGTMTNSSVPVDVQGP